MEKLLGMTLEQIYLDWKNNFISVEGFAAHYGVDAADAAELLTVARSFYIQVYD